MRTIPERRLRHRIDEVLRQVEAGEHFRITVSGRTVAELVPVTGARSTFVPREAVIHLLEYAPLDPAFSRDVDAAGGATVDEL